MATIKNFRDLEVWQKSHQLVLDVERVTRDLPSEEKHGLTSQMRRAAIMDDAETISRMLHGLIRSIEGRK